MSRGRPRLSRTAASDALFCPDCREWNTGDGSICESCTLYPGWRYEKETVRLIGARPKIGISETRSQRRIRQSRAARVGRMMEWHKPLATDDG